MTAPRVHAVMDTPFDLRGTGFPEGVVTANPGTYYTDTAATNGAWRWLKKSGTGSTGWSVVVGDTGWRNITALMPDGLITNGGGYVRARRTDSGGWLDVRYIRGGDAGYTYHFELPAGFEHSSTDGAKGVLIPTDEPGVAGKVQYRSGGSFEWKPLGGEDGFGLFQYLIDVTWPTILPGIPV